MSNEEFIRNEVTASSLHDQVQDLLEQGKIEEATKLVTSITQLESAQSESERVGGEFVSKQEQLAEDKKRYRIDKATSIGGLVATLGLGLFLELKGANATVEPLKMGMKGLQDVFLRLVRRH